ncbi:MAG: NADP-dependent oxidoreductase [Nitrospira sp.]|jgi:NADPH:quinone reductase-like Zn-dependent oxidoreductase|nr:MAG: NADP-dependent oxidoreductase [Nitrospira sp.]
MKAVQIRQYGGNEVLELNSNVPKPVLGNGQVLVEVHAASINPIDWKIRMGHLKEHVPLTMPATLGGDFAGVVMEIGRSDSTLKVGDRVYGYGSPLSGGSGSFAEFVAALSRNVALAPEKMNAIQAAALPLVGASAIQALEEHIKLQRDQKVLIHGGGGGIGSIAIQIAKATGAYVATTATGDDLEYVRELGADQVINYKNESFEAKIKEVDAVFDTVGGTTTAKSFQVLRRGGCLVSMLGQPDETLARQHEVTAIGQFTRVTTDVLIRLARLVDSGQVKIRIGKVLSLEKGKEAFQLAEEGHPNGKVVFEVKAGA